MVYWDTLGYRGVYNLFKNQFYLSNIFSGHILMDKVKIFTNTNKILEYILILDNMLRLLDIRRLKIETLMWSKDPPFYVCFVV